MKTIGLLGGITWESTAMYYQTLNELVKKRLGGSHSAQCLVNSINFHTVERHLLEENWGPCASVLSQGAKRLEAAGADFLLLCTSTMHRVSDEIAASVSIPLLHIADAMADELQKTGVRRVGLLGTRYTMEQGFNKSKVRQRGIDVVVPDFQVRSEMHRIILRELCLGIGKDSSRDYVLKVVDQLAEQDIEGIILGCAEIGLLIDGEDTSLPLYDATFFHAKRAVDLALE